jgi:tRNA 5-methylaminomethyl-2-thiouridine biosynthesis bifunctional protein
MPNDEQPADISAAEDNGSNSGCAALKWDRDGLPLSEEFDDYYYSKLNGLEETQYIYLEHNQLAQRFAALCARQSFVIGETGFGTGLSFLASWKLWSEQAPPSAKLHYISVEKHPLCHSDLARALKLWPQLGEPAQQLAEHYPQILHPGFHRLSFEQGRVELTLIIADACDGLQQLLQSQHPAFMTTQRAVDAWFLDGFSPAKNPLMWRPELFQRVHQLSAKTATLATFAAATIVKRGLRDNGFSITTHKGFGKKREMVSGQLIHPYRPAAATEFEHHRHNSPHPVPWAVQRKTENKAAAPAAEKAVVIIGAGIAGCHTAHALAQRGWKVTLVEQNTQLASEGSGNPQGVLYAKLSHRQETLSDFNLLALQFAQRHYQPYWRRNRNPIDSSSKPAATQTSTPMPIGQQCGVLQLAHNPKVILAQQKLAQTYPEQDLFQPVDAVQASAISGLPCEHSGIFYPSAGWLNPAALCHQLCDHPNIQLRLNSQVSQLTRHEQQWCLELAPGEFIHSPNVVLTTANHLKRFEQTEQLPLKPIRGQVSYVQASTTSQKLKTVICGDGYLPPASQDQHCLGATFDPKNSSLNLLDEDHQRNLKTLSQQLPAMSSSLTSGAITGGRAAFRCTTPDYLPLAGPAPIYDNYLEDYALLRKNARSSIAVAGACWPGLYVNVGHGSRGLTYTPICAEIIAAQMNAEPSPVGQDLEASLHPGRFWIRDLCRGKR